MVSDHLYLLSENFSLYFPESLTDECKQYKWILNPFHFNNYEDYKLDGTTKDLLIGLCNDGTKESHFRGSYSDFWIKMFHDSEYESLTTITVLIN